MDSTVPQQEDKIDFFKATLPRLVGGPYVLPTLKFLVFRRLLGTLTKNITDKGDPADRAGTIIDIMEVAGIKGDEKTLTGLLTEIILANPAPPMLPWQRTEITDKEKNEDIVLESDLGYEGRELAEIVATLASAFGWTADYILGILTYAEVAMYMQEALLKEHSQLNWLYTFSETGFKKEGNEYVKVPLPTPDWMKRVKPVRMKSTVKIPDRFKPDGVIIDYTRGQGG